MKATELTKVIEEILVPNMAVLAKAQAGLAQDLAALRAELLGAAVRDTQPPVHVAPPVPVATNYVIPGPAYGYHKSAARVAAVGFAQATSGSPRGTSIPKCLATGRVTAAQIHAHCVGMDRGTKPASK